MAGRAGNRSPAFAEGRLDAGWMSIRACSGRSVRISRRSGQANTPAAGRNDPRSRLVDHGVHLHFVSNSSTTFISRRLRDLFGDGNPVTANISVQSDAGKFRICELNWDDQAAVSVEAKRRFQALPVAYGEKLLTETERPIYLRRAAYFEAINRVLAGDFDALTNTVFCGDTWEMDLAMPYALGAKVHLLDRATPFETYRYEKQALAGYGDRGKTSADLSGLFDWL